MKSQFLSVVIPAYNEETNIRLGALEKVSRYLSGQPYTWDVTIVDDGSSDATPGLLDVFVKNNRGFSVLHNPHQGKAATVIFGVMAARGSIVLFTDLDQATPISELGTFCPGLKKGLMWLSGPGAAGGRAHRQQGE